MKEDLKPHHYPAKRVSIGPRQLPKPAAEPAGPSVSPPATIHASRGRLAPASDATARQTATER